MNPAPLEPNLRLRAPGWAFGPLALALAFVVALAWSVWAASGFVHFHRAAAPALAVPVALGAGIALFSIGRRLLSGGLGRRDIIVRAALAFAIAGLVWPLSFALAILAQGDSAGAWSNAPHAAMGAMIGAIGGGAGGAAAAWSCFVARD